MYLPVVMSTMFASDGINRLTTNRQVSLNDLHECLIKKDVIPGIEKWAKNNYTGLESTVIKTGKYGSVLTISIYSKK